MLFNSIAVDKNGNTYIAGGQSLNGSDRWVIKKFDGHGIEDAAHWAKTISAGDTSGYGYAQAVAIDIYGNVYVAGNGNDLISSTSGLDWWIKKFDSQGVEAVANWDKKFDGNDGPDLLYSLTTDSRGNVYVAGKSYNLVSNTSGSESGYDWWIKKFDSNGVEDTLHWNKMIDSEENWDAADAIAVDSDNSVYVAGKTSQLYPYVPSGDYWLIKKFDENGVEDVVRWNKQIYASYEGEPKSVLIDGRGGVYVIGYGNNLVGSDSYNDWWIKKFDKNGIEDTVNWDKRIDNTNIYANIHMSQNNKNDQARSAVLDKNGNLYAVGYGTSNINDTGLFWYSEGWIKKYNSTGIEDTVNWDRKISILQDNAYYSSNVQAVAVDVDANVYAAGTRSGKAFVRKYNSNGGDN